jgi:hypothetical protein
VKASRHFLRNRNSDATKNDLGGIASKSPEDVPDVRDGVLRFVEAQVAPRIERNRALLEDQRFV